MARRCERDAKMGGDHCSAWRGGKGEENWWLGGGCLGGGGALPRRRRRWGSSMARPNFDPPDLGAKQGALSSGLDDTPVFPFRCPPTNPLHMHAAGRAEPSINRASLRSPQSCASAAGCPTCDVEPVGRDARVAYHVKSPHPSKVLRTIRNAFAVLASTPTAPTAIGVTYDAHSLHESMTSCICSLNSMEVSV